MTRESLRPIIVTVDPHLPAEQVAIVAAMLDRAANDALNVGRHRFAEKASRRAAELRERAEARQ